MPVKSHIEVEPGLKIAAQMSSEPGDEEMALVRQMGVEYAVIWIGGAEASPEYYRSRREHFARGGIKLYGLGNGGVHNVDAITLSLPNRDEKVEEYKQHLRNLGQADIPYTTYAHMANSVWSTPPEPTRGGASARLERADPGRAGEQHLSRQGVHGGGLAGVCARGQPRSGQPGQGRLIAPRRHAEAGHAGHQRRGTGLGDGRLVGRRRRGWHAALQEQAGEGEKKYGTDRDGKVKEHDRAFLKGDCRRGAVQVQ